ncbi:copper chaperone PCu(A)C [Rhizobium leguminosarum]|uniref:copper chaperone PCu(A)C n=1 Tax=Rhizobium leguminosarum TaxID=384 RepID=UPI001C946A44|nr:copper chaperone PCu(A)C [Rhizobium leguminosarum]MBY5357675.1 copper chaperone PCu(A)C [Rhizobium leguminosarum]
MSKSVSLIAAFTLACFFSNSAMAGDITIGALRISEPYVRAMVPGAPVGGGYMTITNIGTTDDRLIAASSPRAGTMQIHEMTMDKDVMVMRELTDGLTIPAGKTVELKPGGYHIMFMKVGEPFKQGEMVKSTLTFEKAGTVAIDFPVGPVAGGRGTHQEIAK